MSGFPQGNEFNQQPNGYEATNNGGFNQNGGGYDNNVNPSENGNNMENIAPTGSAQPATNEAARTLWMGDLDSWMDEAFIKTVFLNTIGEQVSVKIIRDRQSGNAGYCFAEFTSPEAATKALGLTGTPIQGTQNKQFKLNWASGGGLVDRRDDRGPEFSIFVGDLGPEVTEYVLVALFQARYASCKSAKIMTDANTGQSRGYGFVRFTDEGDQQRALQDMQGVYCGNRPMRISTATPKSRNRSQNPGGPAFQNGGGHGGPMMGGPMQQPGWGMQGPAPYYPGQQPYGGMQPGPGGPPVGMGGGMPGGAMGGMGGGMPGAMGGGAMAGQNSLNQFTDPNNTTVFVGGLSGYVTEDELRSFFQGFGEITYVKIPPGKGCGFVQFVHRHAAEMAINQMQGYPIGNSRVRLSWGRSQNNSGVGTPYRPAPPPPHYSGGPPPPGPYNPGGPFGGGYGSAPPTQPM